KPDELVLMEKEGKIILRKGRFYPRHFSLVLPKTIHSTQLSIDASAKGNLDVKIKLSIAVSLSLQNIQALINAGGWNKSAVQKATREFETVIHSIVREFTEKYEIEELSSEKIYNYLTNKINVSKEKFGLEVVSISIQSFEVLDPKIAEAIRQQESARIFEQTELLNQKARISAAKAKLQADEEIALMENELELKKYELKKIELEKESELADKRVAEELKRKKMQLDYEKEELELLKKNPELLILTPQAARLAEASQSLKNARTVVTLSPNDLSHGSELLGLFQNFLQNYLNNFSKTQKEKSNKE
ncbi:MAG: SPFH domain-containing protein, partial [Melioribacter sp.]|nr:SPFH domain-containing protein [Melioribacter sp.]